MKITLLHKDDNVVCDGVRGSLSLQHEARPVSLHGDTAADTRLVLAQQVSLVWAPLCAAALSRPLIDYTAVRTAPAALEFLSAAAVPAALHGPFAFSTAPARDAFLRALRTPVLLHQDPADPALFHFHDTSDQLSRSRISFLSDTRAPHPKGLVNRCAGAVAGFIFGFFGNRAAPEEAPACSALEDSGELPMMGTDSFQLGMRDAIANLPEKERPVDATEFAAFLDPDSGCMSAEAFETFQHRCFAGGIEDSVRAKAWLHLFGFYPHGVSKEAAATFVACERARYTALKTQWLLVDPEQEKSCHLFCERRQLIQKDVRRTETPYPDTLANILMTYSMLDQDTGYCQGMNDVASLLLDVLGGDEVTSFWCFRHAMERFGARFSEDQLFVIDLLRQLGETVQAVDQELFEHIVSQNGENMYFCYRWLLVLFRREFSPADTKRVWEALFSGQRDKFELTLATAMLMNLRGRILSENMPFDDMLALCNSAENDVEALLTMEQVVFNMLNHRFHRLLEETFQE